MRAGFVRHHRYHSAGAARTRQCRAERELPSMVHLAATWSTASYGLALEEWNVLEASSGFKARAAVPLCS